MQKEQSHTSSGFSMVEIILAIAIFLVFLSAVSGLTLGFWQQARNAVNKEMATYLAQEAIEASRNMRDADFANLQDGTHGVSVSGNTFVYSGASDVTDIFTRQLTVSTINANQKRLNVVVSWVDSVYGNNSVTLETYLTNWRKVTPPPGLTFTKTVINHGNNKSITDFGPYNATATVMLGDPPEPTEVVVPLVSGETTIIENPGTYTISETTDANYDTTYSGDCNLVGIVELALGDAKICNITNEEKASYLTVNKTVINHGSSKTALDFSLFVDAVPVTSGDTNTFDSGIHTVSETIDPNYNLTFSGDCNSSGVVTLVAGTTKTCTLTNEESIILTTPTVTTTSPITSITRTTATGGGNVTSDGGAAVTARGVVWSTSTNPTIALPTKTLDGIGTGSFSSSLTSLTCNTLYYVKAYATNSVGTSYGSEVTFTTSACSAITFVGANSANATTVTIPAHNVGDLLVIFAYRSNSNTPPTVPAGWTTIDAAGGANNSSALGYRIATGGDTSGTWTNASELIVQIYRGVAASPIGGFGTMQSANSKIVTYPAVTMSVTDGSSWIIGSAGAASTTSTIENPPTGMTLRVDAVGASVEAAGFDTNGGVNSWTAKNVTISGSNVKWSARTLEIKSQ